MMGIIMLIITLSDSTGALDTMRVSMPSVAGPVITTMGAVSMGAGALIFKLSADASYGDYKNARTTADAESFRDRTGTFDKLAAWTAVAAGGMLVTTVILWARYETLKGRYVRGLKVRADVEREGICVGAYVHF